MTRAQVGAKDDCRVAGPVHPNTPEQRQRAALYVAGHARDVDDARLILDALGLTEEDCRGRR